MNIAASQIKHSNLNFNDAINSINHKINGNDFFAKLNATETQSHNDDYISLNKQDGNNKFESILTLEDSINDETTSKNQIETTHNMEINSKIVKNSNDISDNDINTKTTGVDENNDIIERFQNSNQEKTHFIRSSQTSVNISNVKSNRKKKERKSKSTTSLIRRLFLCGGTCVSNRDPINPIRNQSNDEGQYSKFSSQLIANENSVDKSSSKEKLIRKNLNETIENDNVIDPINSSNQSNNVKIDEIESSKNYEETSKQSGEIVSSPKFVLPLLKLNDDFLLSNTNDEYLASDVYENALSSNNINELEEYFNEELIKELNLNETASKQNAVIKNSTDLGDDGEFLENEIEDFFEPAYDEEYEEEEEQPGVGGVGSVEVDDDEEYDGEDNIEKYFINEKKILAENNNNSTNFIDYSPSISCTTNNKNHQNNAISASTTINTLDIQINEYNNSNKTSPAIHVDQENKLPLFSFEVSNVDDDLDANSNNNLTKTNNNANESGSSNANNLSVTNFYSKFSTANNIITDRGCIVNVRTGSFNLGCGNSDSDEINAKANNQSSNNLFLDSKQNDEFIFRRGISSNVSVNDFNYDSKSFMDDESSEYDGSNFLISLLLLNKRKKNSFTNLNSSCLNSKTSSPTKTSPTNLLCTANQPSEYRKRNDEINIVLPSFESEEIDTTNLNEKNLINDKNNLNILNSATNVVSQSTSINNNLLGVLNGNNEQQEQTRRSSHDPNIEKLHKTYINNVKLGNNNDGAVDSSEVSVSTTNTDSASNIIISSLTKRQETSSPKSTKQSFKDKFMSRRKSKEKSSFKSKESSSNYTIEQDSNSEKSRKVKKWLIDNNSNETESFEESSIRTQLKSESIEEDTNVLKSDVEEDNGNNYMSGNNNRIMQTFETNDSAIDMRSYGSISTLSKRSSLNRARCNWQSFYKYYNLHFFQSNNTTWSKYQISAISLEQLMALRKLALIQFSKLIERQHSSMIRTFKLFSKKIAIDEFQQSYESVESNKNQLETSNTGNQTNVVSATSSNNDSSLTDNIVIDKKISHQLGAQISYQANGVIIVDKKGRLGKNNKKSVEKTNSNPTDVQSNNSNTSQNEKASLTKKYSEDSKENLENLKEASKNNYKLATNNVPAKKTVFGLGLNTIMQHTGQPLPQRIIEAMKFIRKIAPNEIGIFRKNGNKSRINKLKEYININEKFCFNSDELTVFDIADTIKLFFRELPECLITNKLSDILLPNYSKIRPEERKMVLQQVMLLIPDENRLVLQTLLLFLSEIAKYHKTNQMTRSNLAVCFSPVIFNLNYDNKKKIKYSKTPSTNSNNITNISQQQVNPSPPFNLPTKVATGNNSLNIDDPASIKLSKSNPNLFSPSSNSSSPSNLDDIASVSSSVENINTNDENNNKPLLTEQTSISIDSSSQETQTNNNNNNTNNPLKNTNKQLPDTSSKLITTTHLQNFNPTILSVESSLKSNKRKYSERLNKAANTIVNFGAELSSNTSTVFFSDQSKENLENLEFMSRLVQLCVSDMIKYSIDLFTVPAENFEKLKLSVSYGSEPCTLEYLYDLDLRQIKKAEFFTSNINIEKTYWFYLDKYEDVSIYYFKNEYIQQQQKLAQSSNTNLKLSYSSQELVVNNLEHQHRSSTTGLMSQSNTQATNVKNKSSLVNTEVQEHKTNVNDVSQILNEVYYLPQKNECFNNKLKLWKCCTLVKHHNITVEKILNRIKNERHLWDDDFKEGKVVEVLDGKTDLYRYVITFMPPHPSRDFFEIRHESFQQYDNPSVVLTSTSVQQKPGNKLVGDIRANMLISKYLIEKLIATDTTTTFKITHYIKLDYKGFTLEFYNRTFGYMMARLLHKLKQSLIEDV